MKLKRNHFSGLGKIFGEKGKNLAEILNTKPDHEAFDEIEPLATDPEPSAADIAQKVNEILTALKTPSSGGGEG